RVHYQLALSTSTLPAQSAHYLVKYSNHSGNFIAACEPNFSRMYSRPLRKARSNGSRIEPSGRVRLAPSALKGGAVGGTRLGPGFAGAEGRSVRLPTCVCAATSAE